MVEAINNSNNLYSVALEIWAHIHEYSKPVILIQLKYLSPKKTKQWTKQQEVRDHYLDFSIVFCDVVFSNFYLWYRNFFDFVQNFDFVQTCS